MFMLRSATPYSVARLAGPGRNGFCGETPIQLRYILHINCYLKLIFLETTYLQFYY